MSRAQSGASSPFVAPAWITLASLVGLVSALIGDGVFDVVSWLVFAARTRPAFLSYSAPGSRACRSRNADIVSGDGCGPSTVRRMRCGIAAMGTCRTGPWGLTGPDGEIAKDFDSAPGREALQSAVAAPRCRAYHRRIGRSG